MLIFSAEPGGAEVLSPVAQLLFNAGEYDVRVLGYGHGLTRFLTRGIRCNEIAGIAKGDNAIIERYRPDLIVTSAAGIPECDMSEKHLWETARRQGVMTIAFLDQWQNYTLRFSGPGGQERLNYLPNIINCIDGYAREEMKAEGFPDNILFPLGHPSLSSLKNRYCAVELTQASVLVPGGDFNHDPSNTVLFVSEAIREHFGNQRGYDQFDALLLLLKNIFSRSGTCGVIVKLHPKDEEEKYRELGARFPGLDIRVIKNDLSPLECLRLADTVFGMTSIMLIEAFLLGKRVVSIQPGLHGVDQLILSRRGLIPVLTDRRRFDVFGFPIADPSQFPVSFDGERFLHHVHDMIKNNKRKEVTHDH